MQIQTQIHQISETKKAKTVRLLETSDLLLHSKKKKNKLYSEGKISLYFSKKTTIIIIMSQRNKLNLT